MPLVRDRCVCLRKVEFSETSQVLSLFGRTHGIVRLIAKGAHRRTKAGASKFDGGVDLLDVGEAVFSFAPERELPPLTEWKQMDGRLGLRRHLRAVYLGQYAAELVALLIHEHDPHVALFDRFSSTLDDMVSERREELFLAFELDLLRESGYLPELARCASCGKNVIDRAFFSPGIGGVVCRDCEMAVPDRMEIDVRLLRMMQGILQLPRKAGVPQRLPSLTRRQTDPINRLLAAHVEQVAQRRLRLPVFILNGG